MSIYVLEYEIASKNFIIWNEQIQAECFVGSWHPIPTSFNFLDLSKISEI